MNYTNFLISETEVTCKMRATNIIWDTDDESVILPLEIEIPAGMVDEDEISDYISDITGFCHNGFCLA